VGCQICGLIGADILNEFYISINLSEQYIEISKNKVELDGHSIEISDFMGIPIIPVTIHGQIRRMFFDTGAQISYFQDDAIESFPCVGHMSDFFPGYGEFETDIYSAQTVIGDKTFSINYGRLPTMLGLNLKMANVDGIIGNEILQDLSVAYHPKQSQLIFDAFESQPHVSWANVYDDVYAQSFGKLYHDMTQQTVEMIKSLMPEGARIIDFGAGTGRLSIPLAAMGYDVVAVEPCKEMLEQLILKNNAYDILTVQCNMQDYQIEEQCDIALCVFTVLLYLLDEDSLKQSIKVASESIKPGGYLMIDIPSEALFHNYEHYDARINRSIEINLIDNDASLYRYSEKTKYIKEDEIISYSDTFKIKYWPVDYVKEILGQYGFKDIQSLTAFSGTGSNYFLCKKAN
jgi:2-polyprenyl-3-methyl-5-hydroxy-6-metoxy-1,4-benzoquinol methylase